MDDWKCDFSFGTCDFLASSIPGWAFYTGTLNTVGQGPNIDHTVGTSKCFYHLTLSQN